MLTGRTDAEAEAPIPWPPDEKSWLIVKDPDSGKIRAGEGGDRWLDCIIDSMDMSLSNLGDSEGQGSLAYWSPWGLKELYTA